VPRRTVRPAAIAPEIVRPSVAACGPVRRAAPRPAVRPARWTLPAILMHLAFLGVLVLIGQKALAPAGEDTAMVTVAFVTVGPRQAETDIQTQAPPPGSQAVEALATTEQTAPRSEPATEPEAESRPQVAPSTPPAMSEAVAQSDPTTPTSPAVDAPAVEALPLPPPPPPRVAAASPPRPRVVPVRPRTDGAQAVAPSPSTAPTPTDARPAPSGSAAGPTGASATAPADGDWAKGVLTWLQAHRTYPPEAQRRGEQGAALVRLTVARDGRVRTFTLMQGTGSPRLDAAVEALLSHAELPPFPASMPQPEATIQIPIRYQLTS
jgi:periplasmic protein TonB